jgi:hypothetical protein
MPHDYTHSSFIEVFPYFDQLRELGRGIRDVESSWTNSTSFKVRDQSLKIKHQEYQDMIHVVWVQLKAQ